MDAESILKKAFPELCDREENAGPSAHFAPRTFYDEPTGNYELPPIPIQTASPPPFGGVYATAPAPSAPTPPSQHGLGNRFDLIASEIHKLEQQCQREREQATRWKEQAEQLVKRLRTVELSEKQLLLQITELAQGESSATADKKTMGEELSKTRTELDQYRKAWIVIRKREEAARLAMQENTTLRSQLETISHQARQLQALCTEERTRTQASARHAASLEEAMRQIHEKVQTIEKRNLSLTTELQTLHELCKSYEAELARISESTRAREEAFRLAGEKELLARLEQAREESRKLAADELARERAAQDQRLEKLRAEAQAARQEDRQSLSQSIAAEMEGRHERELAALRTTLTSVRDELSAARTERQGESELTRKEIEALREARTLLEGKLIESRHLDEDRSRELERLASDLKRERARMEEERAAAGEETLMLEQRLRATVTQVKQNEAKSTELEQRLQDAQALAARTLRDARHSHEGELQDSTRRLEAERKRGATLERECELMQTALLSQFGEARELALRIEEGAQDLAGAEHLVALAQDLAGMTEIATVQPTHGAGNDGRAGRSPQAKLDC